MTLMWVFLTIIFLLMEWSDPYARERMEILAELADVPFNMCLLIVVASGFFFTSPLAFGYYLATHHR